MIEIKVRKLQREGNIGKIVRCNVSILFLFIFTFQKKADFPKIPSND